MLKPLVLKKRVSRQSQKGSVLIEAMVAVVVFSTGVLALVGLQVAMTKNSSDNQYRTQANMIAQSQLANMMTYGTAAKQYVDSVDKNRIAKQLPNGVISFSPINNNLVTVTVSWQLPGGIKHEVNASSYLFDVIDG